MHLLHFFHLHLGPIVQLEFPFLVLEHLQVRRFDDEDGHLQVDEEDMQQVRQDIHIHSYNQDRQDLVHTIEQEVQLESKK